MTITAWIAVAEAIIILNLAWLLIGCRTALKRTERDLIDAADMLPARDPRTGRFVASNGGGCG